MAFAELNGVVLHYADEGLRDAPVIAFSNSLGTDFRIWDGVVEALGEQFRTIRYDKRGHGLSTCPPSPYTMDEHVGDFAALLDHVGVGNAIIVGLSVGGLIAQGLTAARPGLARAVVLCDTAHKIMTDEIWNQRIAAVEADGLEALADGTMERWFSNGFRATETAALAGSRNMLVRTPEAGYVGTCVAIRETDYTAVAKAINVPVLCVVGDEDGATPPDVVRATSEIIPGAKFIIIEGAGHLPCVEKPATLAGHITEFLSASGVV